MLRPEKVDSQKCGHSQHQCHGDVARHIRTCRENRYQPHQVVHEDEEKDREQVGRELAPPFSDAGADDAVQQRRTEHLEQPDRTARCLLGRLMAAIPARNAQHEHNEQRTVYQQPCRCLGN